MADIAYMHLIFDALLIFTAKTQVLFHWGIKKVKALKDVKEVKEVKALKSCMGTK